MAKEKSRWHVRKALREGKTRVDKKVRKAAVASGSSVRSPAAG